MPTSHVSVGQVMNRMFSTEPKVSEIHTHNAKVDFRRAGGGFAVTVLLASISANSGLSLGGIVSGLFAVGTGMISGNNVFQGMESLKKADRVEAKEEEQVANSKAQNAVTPV